MKRADSLTVFVTATPKSTSKQIKYVLDMLALFLGVKLRVVDKDAEITFTAPDFDSWKSNNVRVTYIDDVPVLYTNARPVYFIQNGRIGFDILAATFWLLTRQEETERKHRDQWGNFRSSFSALNTLSLLYKPIINYWVNEIANYIEKQFGTHRIPLWKDGKAFAAALTHDVDLVNLNSVKERLRAYKVLPYNGSDIKLSLTTLASPFYALVKTVQSRRRLNASSGFEKWLRLEERYNAKSTFFFFANRIGRRHPVDAFYSHEDTVVFESKKIRTREMIKQIAGVGWEVGLHGSFYSSEDAQELQCQKNQLEEVLQDDVEHVRQHFLRFNVSSTPLIHEKSRFKSDTTLGFNRNVGFRAGVGYPFKLWHFEEEREIGTWEIPLVIQDGALLQMDFLGLTDLDLALETCIRLAEEAERTGGLIVLLWHPHTIAEDFYPGWFELYERLLEYLAKRGCWLASIGEITDWWEQRSQSLYAA